MLSLPDIFLVRLTTEGHLERCCGGQVGRSIKSMSERSDLIEMAAPRVVRLIVGAHSLSVWLCSVIPHLDGRTAAELLRAASSERETYRSLLAM